MTKDRKTRAKLRGEFASLLLGLFLIQTCLSPLIALTATSAWAGSSYQDSYCDAFCTKTIKDPNSSYSHSGQALQQCEAYETSSSASSFQQILLPLDFVAAGVCAAACFTTWMSAGTGQGTGQAACSYSAGAAGIAELLAVFSMQSSGVSKAIEGVGGAAAIGGAVLGVTHKTGGIGFLTKEKKLDGKKLACAEAALMTILAVMRAQSTNSDSQAQQNACNAIKNLTSSANGIASNSLFAPQGLGGSTSSGTSSGSSAPPSGGGNGQFSPGGAACAQNGLGSTPGGCGFSANQLAATDAQNLDGSGLAQIVAPDAAKINPSDLLQKLTGSDPGSAFTSAFGSKMQPLADLAQAAAENAADLQAALAQYRGKKDDPSLLASARGGGGGGGGGGARPKAAGNGFNFDFGGGTGAAGGAPAGELGFASSKSKLGLSGLGNGDIWHQDFHGSIFEIVTSRLNSSRDRIDDLDWVTPLNRALAGSPKKMSGNKKP